MSQSIPYQLSAAVVSALTTDMGPSGVAVIDNPTTAAALDKGSRVVFVEDRDDNLISKEGQAEARTFGFVIGVINRTDGARAGADADMQQAKAVATLAARNACAALLEARSITKFNYPREGQRTYRHERIDIDGALVLTSFEIDYRLLRPA
jgi:hypothetical protein